MKDETRDFLDDFTAEDAPEGAPSPAPADQTAPVTETDAAVVRDEKGRFAPKAAQDIQKGVSDARPASEPEPPSEQKEQLVPLDVVKALRHEIQELKAQLKPSSSAGPTPDSRQTPPGPETISVPFEENPAEHLFQTKLQMSMFMAQQAASEQEVADAWAKFNAAAEVDPLVSQWSWQLRNHPHPMGEVLKWHRKQRDLEMLEEAGGLDQLLQRRIAEMQQASPTGHAPSTRQASPPMPAPPPSLTRGAGSAGAPVVQSDDEVFDAVFAGSKTRKR